MTNLEKMVVNTSANGNLTETERTHSRKKEHFDADDNDDDGDDPFEDEPRDIAERNPTLAPTSSNLGENEESEASPIPIDRGWAWMIVAGCFGMHVLVVGGVKSFGVLFVELQHKYDVTAQQLGVVHGLASAVMMALGPVSNALSVRFSCRLVVFAGGLLMCCGFVTSAFVESFYWLYLSYSCITGLGLALAYAPSVVMVGHHFTKHRALANGISVSGSGVGSFILPNLMRHVLNVYGLQGALAIIGAIMLHVCAFAVLFRPLSSYKLKKTKTEELTGSYAIAENVGKDEIVLQNNSENNCEILKSDSYAENFNNCGGVQLVSNQLPTTESAAGGNSSSTRNEAKVANSQTAQELRRFSFRKLKSFGRSESTDSAARLAGFRQAPDTESDLERKGSLKILRSFSRNTEQSASLKRQTRMRMSESLERHPSALLDTRPRPGSLKQHPSLRRLEKIRNFQRGDSFELSTLRHSTDTPTQNSSDRGLSKILTSTDSRQSICKGSEEVHNPIKFIQERKKLLQAHNFRYTSETGSGPARSEIPSAKAPLKRFYSVETGHHPTATPQSSFLHRRIRQLSEPDSWKSESSLFASAGDLALASLQNISESATETDDERAESSQFKGSAFFRLSAKTVHRGQTKSTSVPLFEWSLLVNPVFLVFFASLVFMNFGYPNIFVMLPSYCQDLGLDKNMGAFLVSVIGLADLAGRIFIGWFSDLRLFPRKYSFTATMAATGALCVALPSLEVEVGLTIFCCCFGFCGGCFIALIAVILVDSLGKERLATSFGLGSTAMAIGIFAGPTIYGSIRDQTGSWDGAFVMSGVMSIAAASCMFLEPLAQRKLNRAKVKEPAETLQDSFL